MICQICNKELKSYVALGQHIRSHNIKSIEYYDKYLKQPDEGYCKYCNELTKWYGFKKGYIAFCTKKCAGLYNKSIAEQTNLIKYGTKNPAQNKIIREKISKSVKSKECQDKTKQTNIQRYNCERYINVEKMKQTKIEKYGNDYAKLEIQNIHKIRQAKSERFEKENNCTRIGKLIEKYGQGWLSIKDQLNTINLHGYTYIHNEDIYKIKEYQTHISKIEQSFIDLVNQFYNLILHSRSIINPYELDIYVKELNLAIEINGTWFHSIEYNKSKDYHLNKSLLCREKEIRLIHIYEFEDINKQKQLLKDFILGIDNYHPNDFNKNNLLNEIPEPVLIYTSNRNYHIYGAGELY